MNLLVQHTLLHHMHRIVFDLGLSIRQLDFSMLEGLDVLFELIEDAGYETDKINTAINDGTAIAALMTDYQQAKAQSLKGSPTYIIDNGRQVLYGNVGYRVLLANIEEQLKAPLNEASWC